MKNAVLFLAAVSLIVCLSGCQKKINPLRTTILDVGKADAIIIQTNTKAVLIDCGEKDDGGDVVEFLEENAISSVEYMIITHFDKDHVGGAAKVLKNIPVENVIVPDYTHDSKEVENFIAAMNAKNIKPLQLTEPLTIQLEGADFTLYPSMQRSYAENYDNNHSIVTAVQFYDTSLLFAADATKERLSELMTLGHYDFLKVPYHGRTIDNLDEFLTATSPVIAAVSTSSEEFKTEDLLKQHGITYQSTCNDGDVTVISDGTLIYFE